MKVDPIAAIPENEASGETAELFADLRATLGVPFVNLIWRHLATLPGVLPAIWERVRPLYVSAELEGRAADLRIASTTPGIEPLPSFVWDCGGVDERSRRAIGHLVTDYNRANSINFLALSTASIILRGEGVKAKRRRSSTPMPRRISETEVPPLQPIDGLRPQLRALVQSFDELGRLGASDAIASLLRHLAQWPAFLAISYAALLPHHRAGTLQTAQHTLIAEGRGIASVELLPLVPPAQFDLPPESRKQALEAIDDFTGLMIGRMVVMGTALRQLLAVPEEQMV